MKNQTLDLSSTDSAPEAEAVRDYAYHLYEQSGCAPGHDLENWLEAEACLRANIPKGDAHGRLHRVTKGGAFASSVA